MFFSVFGEYSNFFAYTIAWRISPEGEGGGFVREEILRGHGMEMVGMKNNQGGDFS